MLSNLKLLGLSAALASGACFGVGDAQAFGRGHCCGCVEQARCCAPSCAAPSCAAPSSVIPAPAPATDAPAPPVEPKAATEGRQRYQSAYQVPGAAPNYAPMRNYSTRNTSDQLGAGRKFLGKFGN